MSDSTTGSTSASETTSSHSLIVTVLAEVIGVSILAILADTSDTIGNIAVAIMIGWLLLFLMSNAQSLSEWTSKL